VFGCVLDLLAIIFMFVIKLRGLCGLMVAMLLCLFCWDGLWWVSLYWLLYWWCYLIGSFGVVFVIGFGVGCVDS